MKSWQLKVVGVLLATVLISGCAPLLLGGAAVGVGVAAHDRRTTGTLVDDQSIEVKIHNTLNQRLPPGNRIGVTSYNATVLLTGVTASEATRQQAEMIARGITPVKEVYNELAVGSPKTSFSAQSNDSLLTTKVKAVLFKIRIQDFDPTRVKVVTEGGVVYLMGLVRKNEADAAANTASQVSGVKQVVTLFEYID